MRIAIANDVPMAAEALRRVLLASGEHQVAWIARTGVDAVRLCADLPPDLVLMDLDMPLLDGVEATRRIMANAPCAILVVTARPQDNVNGCSARSAPAPSTSSPPRCCSAAGRRGCAAGQDPHHRQAGSGSARSPVRRVRHGRHRAPGRDRRFHRRPAGAGAPVARWRPPPDTAVVVVQHIDPAFAVHLVRWLGEQCRMPVRAIADDDAPRRRRGAGRRQRRPPAPGPGRRLCYDAHPRDEIYRPSIDVFFDSVARHWQRSATGILLTGMGRDGANGLLALRQAGHATIAQDEASSAVYGMPRAAAQIGAAERILGLDAIASLLLGRMTDPPSK
jgi:two-component system response regulator WspF